MGQTLPKLALKSDQSSFQSTSLRPSVRVQVAEMKLNPDDITHKLFASRLELLDAVDARLPYAEAAGWSQIIQDAQRTIYNPRFSNITENEIRQMLGAINLRQVLHNHILLDNARGEEFISQVAVSAATTYSQCFFSGVLLHRIAYTQLVPGVDHPANFVPVAQPFKGMQPSSISTEKQTIVLDQSSNGGGPLVAEHGVSLLSIFHKLVPGEMVSDVIKTSVGEEGDVCPRSAIRGWIARTALMLIDMYGWAAVPTRFISRSELKEWVAYPLSLQEVIHDIISFSISGDVCPFLLLSPSERARYAQSVLERDIAAVPSIIITRPKVVVLNCLECYLIQYSETGKTVLIAKGQEAEDVKEAIRKFETEWFALRKGTLISGLP